MRSSAFVPFLCIFASACSLAGAQEHAPIAAGPPRAEQARPAQDQPPESVFNDRLRKFKFDLEDMVVTAGTAEGFLLRYNRPDNPRIIGAYPDAQTNALVVIGPPEAEQAIRENLAESLVEAQGTGATSLPLQLRLLQHQRKGLLEEMAALEIQKIEVGASDQASADQAARAQQLADRLQMFEGKLQLVERQIETVGKYIDRLGLPAPPK